MKHLKTIFTTNEKLVDEVFRSAFFEDFDKINSTFEIRKCRQQVNISRPYQCSIIIYQLAKLSMLEFCYDFVDKCLDRRDFELIQMDTDLAILGMSIDDIIRPESQEEYDNERKAKFLSTSNYHNRTP